MNMYGLSDQQVALSRERHGSNRMSEQKQEGFAKKLLANLNDPMIQILCVALVINFIFVLLGETAWYEALGIALAVVLAVLVSTISEHRSETAFQTLQAEASKILCKVYRNGSLIELPIDEIVVGDLVLLQLGDKIPADGAMRQGSIQVDQAALNGESEEAEKSALAEEAVPGAIGSDFLDGYSVFRGSVVCGGNGVMEVSRVGDASLYGKLAGELQTEERDSPLKVKLKGLATKISRFGYLGGLIIAITYLFQNIVVHNGFDPTLIAAYFSNGMLFWGDFLQAIMLAVIIIVMAVPEGLPLMIAIVSTQNMGKMLADQVLVRKVTGIETAGSLNLLLSDKTGTITRGQLETVLFLDGAAQSHPRFADLGSEMQHMFAMSVQYNSSAIINKNEDGSRSILGGNATERAMLSFAAQGQTPEADLLWQIPFNSSKKYSLACVTLDQQALTFLKGAPEKLLPYCDTYLTGKGARQSLSSDMRSMLEQNIDNLAKRAIRVLALAVCPEERQEGQLTDGGWTLLGIVGIRDDVRPEAVAAIAQVHEAGVQVVMITGDRKDTATAIAQEAGILSGQDDLIYTSDELAALSDETLKTQLPRLRVVARALPTDKSRLVRLGQELNLVVGMTGDGVNDAPALKRADVGFAMGSGTEVAKEAGDVVILDDNFQSVAKAILYGRTIFNSIRKFIVFQLTINVSAVLISFLAPLFGLEPPLTITQILWINLVMDTLAAMAFGGEPALPKYMREQPRRRDESILSRAMLSSILTGALWTVAVCLLFLLAPFAAVFFRGADYQLTGFFTLFIFTALFNAFNARSEGRNLLANLRKNPTFLRLMGVIVVIQVALTQMGGEIFRCYGLQITEWLFVLALAFLIIPVDLFRKTLLPGRRRNA